ncbi:hypothetical protein AGRA3207_004575 [Actinomadura graeca]|uniref:Uncharacterized protein n=1 Tax=Actinomadura graeca TaxID=2750812 RepID=A0ABX8R139_9ACTN|nr:hypothetical protein [Actinomadura graeca]QXJ23427.1 hypothetical protein AGRA3207_004575 [Actinomadura graeca]
MPPESAKQPRDRHEEPISGRIVPSSSHHTCTHGCDCWKKGFQDYIDRSPEREPHETDNQEAHALLVARNRAIRDVRRRRGELAAARHSVISGHGALQERMNRMRSLTGRRVLPGLAERHSAEGSREEPRPPFWLRVVHWPVVISAGLFDLWYFMQIFQLISLGNRSASLLDIIVTALPGLVLAVGLVVSGHLVGAPLYRAMRRHEALQEQRRGLKRWICGLWPWPMRLALPMTLIFITGLWGAFRAIEANGGQAKVSMQMVGLLVMALAVTAIVIKAAAYDPVAEGRGDARRDLLLVRVRLGWYRRQAHRKLAECRRSWSDLCALRDEVVAQVRGRYGEAYEFITYARGMHGKAGQLPPSFATMAAFEPDPESLAGRVESDFQAVDQPPPEFADLREVQRVILKYDPESMAEELARLTGEADSQLTVTSALSGEAAR